MLHSSRLTTKLVKMPYLDPALPVGETSQNLAVLEPKVS